MAKKGKRECFNEIDNIAGREMREKLSYHVDRYQHILDNVKILIDKLG